nr:DUF4159 domain-containing protein [Rhodohalobacter sp. 614A]
MLNRKEFLKKTALFGAGATLMPVASFFARNHSDFFFTRIQYESGNWYVDERMPRNLMHSLVEYTTLDVDTEERIIPLASDRILSSPFCYLTGHRLVQFNRKEQEHFEKLVYNGGFIFVDDCNHDIDGLFAKSFEEQMAEIFGPDALKKIPNNHPIYSSFFEFEDGPPTTSVELNGWGDDLVHDYLKAIEIDGKIRVLYSNKDYGCEWDYDFRNKRWYANDNTKFGVNIIMYAMNNKSSFS